MELNFQSYVPNLLKIPDTSTSPIHIGRIDISFITMVLARWHMATLGIDPDPANREKIISRAKEYQEALHPYSMGGAYVNFLGDEGEERVRKAYGENYDRLLEIKNKYDPLNLFRNNQNIKPARVKEVSGGR